MRKYLVLLGFFLISGCGSIREFLRPITPRAFQDSAAPVVAPPFTLPAKAAKAQDSLRERLQWISRQKPPSGFTLDRIAFLVRPDSSLALCLAFQDDQRVNSHGMTRDAVRSRMRERLAATRPLVAKVLESGIDHPLILRSSFRSRDFLFQNARWQDDTTSWMPQDSVTVR